MGLSPRLSCQPRQDDAKLAARVEKSVTVHAEVVGQTYCQPDDEDFVVQLTLKISFTNASSKTVVLSRRVESPIIVRAARNAEAASRGDFLYAPDVHFAMNKLPPNAPSFGPAPNPKLFVMLAPRERFGAIVKTSLFGLTQKSPRRNGNGLLVKDTYSLQVGIHTWPYDWPNFNAKTKPEELKTRWSRYGELATGLAFSDFAPFAIRANSRPPRCS
jgi:hypothetical protein